MPITIADEGKAEYLTSVGEGTQEKSLLRRWWCNECHTLLGYIHEKSIRLRGGRITRRVDVLQRVMYDQHGNLIAGDEDIGDVDVHCQACKHVQRWDYARPREVIG